jgi:NAD(P)-dependent dehydrogenase (short-subunit alcohol dehydrogenase family)
MHTISASVRRQKKSAAGHITVDPAVRALIDSGRVVICERSQAADETCCEGLKHFGKDGGRIINIGSMSSERFSAGAVAYTASKGDITGVTGVLAVELASRGIRVNQINPGAWTPKGHGPSVP